MKTKFSHSLLRWLPVVLLLGLANVVWAAPVDLLREAYVHLSHADHDYKGHRAAAMKQIADAGRELGESLHGDGRTRENQVSSDDQLVRARDLLNQAAGQLSGKPLKHVHAAFKDLSIALSVK